MKNNSIVIKKTYDIDKPKEVTAMASVLKKHIISNKLYTTIVGKNYAHVEGWQFAGGIMGLFPKVKAVENLSSGNELKWKAEVEIIDRRSGAVVSTGFAVCSNKENRKKSFDEYAILSMAQTRAIGKAYRNLLGWVMKLAGYEGTPSEEMKKVGEEVSDPVDQEKETTRKDEPEFCVGPKGKGCPEGNPVTATEKNFSMRLYKKQLCRNCQKLAK
jgi:hypothetical protein